MTLALSKAGDTPEAVEGVIDSFRELIGPKDVNIAKEEAPERYEISRLCFILDPYFVYWSCLFCLLYCFSM